MHIPDNTHPKRALALHASQALAILQAAILRWGVGEPYWVSSDGRVTAYSELGDRHLRNILRVMARNGDTTTKQGRALVKEAARRRLRW